MPHDPSAMPHRCFADVISWQAHRHALRSQPQRADKQRDTSVLRVACTIVFSNRRTSVLRRPFIGPMLHGRTSALHIISRTLGSWLRWSECGVKWIGCRNLHHRSPLGEHDDIRPGAECTGLHTIVHPFANLGNQLVFEVVSTHFCFCLPLSCTGEAFWGVGSLGPMDRAETRASIRSPGAGDGDAVIA